MSMKLNLDDLRLLVEQVEKLEQTNLDVSQLRVSGHIVWLQRHDRDGAAPWYEVRGISDKEPVGPSHPIMRGR